MYEIFRDGNRFAVMKRRLIKIPILTWSCIFVLRMSFTVIYRNQIIPGINDETRKVLMFTIYFKMGQILLMKMFRNFIISEGFISAN